jgi:hypothetical protein
MISTRRSLLPYTAALLLTLSSLLMGVEAKGRTSSGRSSTGSKLAKGALIAIVVCVGECSRPILTLFTSSYPLFVTINAFYACFWITLVEIFCFPF